MRNGASLARTDTDDADQLAKSRIARRLEPARNEGRLPDSCPGQRIDRGRARRGDPARRRRDRPSCGPELLFLEATQWPSHAEQVSVLSPVLSRLQGPDGDGAPLRFRRRQDPPFLRGITARGIAVMLNEPQALKAHPFRGRRRRPRRRPSTPGPDGDVCRRHQIGARHAGHRPRRPGHPEGRRHDRNTGSCGGGRRDRPRLRFP